MKIGVIGGGATGLTAGYELAKKGHEVIVFDSEKEIGGLCGTIDVGEKKLEKFYHHVFTNDTEFVDLVEELGLTSKLMWKVPKNGMYINNKLYPFTSPLDLMMFKELGFFERFFMGLMVLRAKFVKDWKTIENTSAKDWIVKQAGKNVYKKVWGPLLSSKFDFDSDEISATWIWNKFKLRGSTRGKNISKELLGYMDGSFGVVYETMAQKIEQLGGKLKCQSEVKQIIPRDDKKLDIVTENGSETFDRVILTAAPEILKDMKLPLPEQYVESLSKIRYKANICMAIEMTEQLSPYYWITVAENDYPFVLVIEHTNLVPDKGYKSHVLYLSRYLDEKNELYSCTDDQIKEKFIEYLKKMFPTWDESKIIKTHINRSRFSQPVVIKGYSNYIPEYKTPVENLYLASMAQIYPEDRGQNYSVRMGRTIAEVVNE